MAAQAFPGETSTSGRGLLLLDAVALRWGIEPQGEGKAVWCDLGPPDPSAEDDDRADGTGT